MIFTETQINATVIQLLEVEGYPYMMDKQIERYLKNVLIKLCDTCLPKLISVDLVIPQATKCHFRD